jgi:murein DD-endopeptidase MepM/ murein hydrolase activator NlpD
MKFIWEAPRGLAKSLAVLGLMVGGLAPVVPVSPASAGFLPLVLGSSLPNSSSILSVALTKDAVSDDKTTAGPESRLVLREMTVSAGDTLAAMLAVAAIDRRDVAAAMTKLRERFNPRKLTIGQKLFVIIETGRRGANRLAALSLELGTASYLVIERRSGRRFASRYRTGPLLLGAGDIGSAWAAEQVLRVRAGDTLSGMMVRAGALLDDADKVARAIGRLVNLRRLQIGQEVILSFETSDGIRAALSAVSLKIAPDVYVTAIRGGKGAFTARRAESPAVPDPVVATPAAPTDIATPPAAQPTAPPEAPPEADVLEESEPDLDDEFRQTYRIVRGDTLSGVLVRGGVKPKLAYLITDALGSQTNLRKLRVGQELTLVFDPGSMVRKGGLAAVSLKLKRGKYIVAGRDEAGGFAARTAAAPLLPTFSHEDPEVAGGRLAVAPLLELTAGAVFKSLQLRQGDTLTTALLRIGGAWSESDAIIAALARYVNPSRFAVGQDLSVVLDKPVPGATRPRLVAVSLTMSEDSYLVARRNDDDSFTAWRENDALDGIYDEAILAAPPPPIELAAIPEAAIKKQIKVRTGDTLMKALLEAGSEPRDAEAAIAVLKTLFDPRKLRAGQRINVALVPGADGGKPLLHRLTIAISPGRDIEAGRLEDGSFAVRAVEAPLERLLVHAGGTIESSLYKAAAGAGVPVPVLWELIRAFSYDVDFQREIQRGDGFEVLFERYLDDTGEPVREGNIIYAALTLSGAPLAIYRHIGRDGFADYYSADGQSVRKALLRTPIDGARLTSGFGKRKHPVLGYTKMHRGVDFGARRGTPFMAAGDGVVVAAGWNGAYGKYIRIRHRGSYSTAYAHLSRIASGVQKGRRVKQGHVIGYVGSTGRSTGPHLHYEILRSGKQINPLKVKLPTGAKLKGAALADFQKSRAEIENKLAALPLVKRVADAMQPPAEPASP